MVDIDKIQQAAEAAVARRDGPNGQWWYDRDDFFNGIDFTEDADFAAACRPQTVLKLIAVVRASRRVVVSLQDGADVVRPMHEMREALEALS